MALPISIGGSGSSIVNQLIWIHKLPRLIVEGEGSCCVLACSVVHSIYDAAHHKVMKGPDLQSGHTHDLRTSWFIFVWPLPYGAANIFLNPCSQNRGGKVKKNITIIVYTRYSITHWRLLVCRFYFEPENVLAISRQSITNFDNRDGARKP